MLAWLQIAASPVLIGAGIGAVFYLYHPSTVRLVIAILLFAAGLIIGIRWANKVMKKRGAVNFMSKVMATPELDGKSE